MTEITSRHEGVGYRNVVLFMLTLVFCLSYVDRQIIGILALPIKTELRLSDTQLGLMGGFAFALFYSLLGIPIARLADRFNRVRIITTALILWSGFTALCGYAGSFWPLLLARLGVGVGEAGGVSPSYSIISDYFPAHQRARAMACFTMAVPIGSAIGLFVGGGLAAAYGWRVAFQVMGVAGLVVTPFFLFTVREPMRGRLEAPAETLAPPRFVDVLAHLRRKPSFWWLSLGAAAASMLSYGFGFWLPAFLHRTHGLDLAETGRSLSAITLVGGVAGTVLGGWLSDALAIRSRSAYGKVPAIAFVVGCPFTLAAMWANGLPLTLALLLVSLAVGGVWMAPTVAAIQLLAPASMRATASSIFLFILNFIGLGVGTLVFGAMSDLLTAHFGDDALRYAIMICAVVLYPLAATFYILAARSLAKDSVSPRVDGGEEADTRPTQPLSAPGGL